MAVAPTEPFVRLVEPSVLDPYSTGSPRYVTVADADALLSSVENHCRRGRRSRILRLATSGTTRVFLEDHVYGEAYRGLPKLARSSPVPESTLRACFEDEYLPALTWVQRDSDILSDPRVGLVTDETDVPTAELASLIAPCVVLSGDRHLRVPGIAAEDWRAVAGHGTDVDRAVGEQQGIVMVVGSPALVVVAGVNLGERVGVPWWVTLLFMGFGAAAVARSPERRRWIGKKAMPVIEMISQLMTEAQARELASVQELKEAMFQAPAPPSLKQEVATVLARSRDPLLAKEVQELIATHFSEAYVPTIAETRSVLRDSTEFRLVERYRWRLGRRAGPWCARS